MAEKMEKDFRHGLEFIMRVRPFYSLNDLLKINYLTYFQLLEECEAEQREAIEKAKKTNT